MTVTKKYSLSAVNLNDTSDVLISGITSQGLQPNSQVDREITSGEVYPRWYGISAQNPTAQFTTFHLATALANIGLQGLKISTLATGLELWLQKHLDESTREGTLKHRRFTLTKGMVVPRRLTVSHGPGQHASITYEIIATYDGANEPFTITDDLTLPVAEADDERFAIGKMTIGGKLLAHFQQFEIDFGITAVTVSADSDIWPTFVSVESIAPVITARGIDPEWLKSSNIPLAGLVCTHANTIMHLRKRVIGGSFVIDATAEHVKLTGAGLAHIDNAFDASGQDAAETSLVLPLVYDGTNDPLTIDTASAIT